MNKILAVLAALLIATTGCASPPAVNDVKVSQAVKVSPPTWVDRAFTPVANSLFGFDSSVLPVNVTLGSGLSLDATTHVLSVIVGTVDASSLTGTTLASNVVSSSLTSVGVLTGTTLVNPLLSVPTIADKQAFQYNPAPSTPSSGIVAYAQSAFGVLTVKNNSGTVSHTVQTKANVAHQFFSALGDQGLITSTQPVQADISGLTTSSNVFFASISAQVIAPSAPPANATDTGTAGTITWDASFIYICISSNTWKRVAISTW